MRIAHSLRTPALANSKAALPAARSFSQLALAQAAPLTIAVDLTDAPRKIVHAELTIPVEAGPTTLLYPKWIPGEHTPSGPIDNLAGLMMTANGQTLAWQSDSVNMFAFHVTVRRVFRR